MKHPTSNSQLLLQYIHENGVRRILARVQPGQPRFLVRGCALENIDGEEVAVLKVALSSPPEEGRANAELVWELEKLLGARVLLQSGHQQRTKTLIITLL